MESVGVLVGHRVAKLFWFLLTSVTTNPIADLTLVMVGIHAYLVEGLVDGTSFLNPLPLQNVVVGPGRVTSRSHVTRII